MRSVHSVTVMPSLSNDNTEEDFSGYTPDDSSEPPLTPDPHFKFSDDAEEDVDPQEELNSPYSHYLFQSAEAHQSKKPVIKAILSSAHEYSPTVKK